MKTIILILLVKQQTCKIDLKMFNKDIKLAFAHVNINGLTYLSHIVFFIT